MTETAVRRPDHPDTDGLRLQPARRRLHVPTLLAGVLLVVGCALAFGVLAQRLAHQRPVLVMARPVARGALLADADVAVAQVSADAGVRLMDADDRQRLLGRTLLLSLPAGAPLTEDLVGPGAVDVGPTARTVGLALEPGEYPVSSLAPGDSVSIVATAGNGRVLDDGIVLAVEPTIDGSATLLVSVVVDASTAERITAAAAQDQIRLVLRGPAQ